MSFLDNTKLFGILAMVVGIISLALGAYSGYDTGNLGSATGAIGGLMLLVLGLLVYLGKFETKPEIVSGYLMVYGLGYVIMGIMQYSDLLTCILFVIIGVIAMFLGYTMYSGGKNNAIFWYILLLIFLLLIIVNFIGIFTSLGTSTTEILGTVSSLLLTIINLYMLLFLLDSSVKSKFEL